MTSWYEAIYFDRFNMNKNGLEYDRKKITPTIVKVWTWPKTWWIWPKKYKWNNFIKETILNRWIWPKIYSVIFTCIVSLCSTFSVLFKWLMFVCVMFLVMYKFFGHIHLVILNRSNEYSSMVFTHTWLIFNAVTKKFQKFHPHY